MKKRVVIIVIVVILAILISIVGVMMKQQDKNKLEGLKTIQVNEVTRSVFYAPQYVAINHGFFRENGLNIELTTGQGAETPLT